MTEPDCTAVSRLQCESFRYGAKQEEYSDKQIQNYCTERASIESIREQLRDYNCYVAKNNSKIVGVIAFKENFITKLYVDPEHIGQGIGKQLFNHVKNLIAHNGYDNLEVVTIFPHTVAFYNRMGAIEISSKIIEHGFMTGASQIKLRLDL